MHSCKGGRISLEVNTKLPPLATFVMLSGSALHETRGNVTGFQHSCQLFFDIVGRRRSTWFLSFFKRSGIGRFVNRPYEACFNPLFSTLWERCGGAQAFAGGEHRRAPPQEGVSQRPRSPRFGGRGGFDQGEPPQGGSPTKGCEVGSPTKGCEVGSPAKVRCCRKGNFY
jgi:hypothetical protein